MDLLLPLVVILLIISIYLCVKKEGNENIRTDGTARFAFLGEKSDEVLCRTPFVPKKCTIKDWQCPDENATERLIYNLTCNTKKEGYTGKFDQNNTNFCNNAVRCGPNNENCVVLPSIDGIEYKKKCLNNF